MEIPKVVQRGQTIPLIPIEKRPLGPSLLPVSPLQKISVNDPRLRKGRVSSILSSTLSSSSSPSETKVHKPGIENLSDFVPSNKSSKMPIPVVVSGLREIDMFQSENSDEDLNELRKVRKPGIGVTNENVFEFACSNGSSKESTPVGIPGLGNINNLLSKNSQADLKPKSETEKLNCELLPSVAKQSFPRKTVQLQNTVKRLHDSGESTISMDKSTNISSNCKKFVPSDYLPGEVVEKRVLIPATNSSLSSKVKPTNISNKCKTFVPSNYLPDKKEKKQAMIPATRSCIPSEVIIFLKIFIKLMSVFHSVAN